MGYRAELIPFYFHVVGLSLRRFFVCDSFVSVGLGADGCLVSSLELDGRERAGPSAVQYGLAWLELEAGTRDSAASCRCRGRW